MMVNSLRGVIPLSLKEVIVCLPLAGPNHTEQFLISIQPSLYKEGWKDGGHMAAQETLEKLDYLVFFQ